MRLDSRPRMRKLLMSVEPALGRFPRWPSNDTAGFMSQMEFLWFHQFLREVIGITYTPSGRLYALVSFPQITPRTDGARLIPFLSR